ncbi:uncharacterized protein LOC134842105 [Symsagittifera roscoffensis]|uniref:uncharacterized protein LOC134842105 n=1 Tax=Symsagittifera roscoffensis TaxID=84072 RepID=UPI00307BC263
MLIGEKKKETLAHMHLKIQRELNELNKQQPSPRQQNTNANSSKNEAGGDCTSERGGSRRKSKDAVRSSSFDDYNFIGNGEAPALRYLRNSNSENANQENPLSADALKFNMVLQSSLGERERQSHHIVIPSCDPQQERGGAQRAGADAGGGALSQRGQQGSKGTESVHPLTPVSSRNSSTSTRKALEQSQEKLFAYSGKVMQAKQEAEERTRQILEKLERKIDDLQLSEHTRNIQQGLSNLPLHSNHHTSHSQHTSSSSSSSSRQWTHSRGNKKSKSYQHHRDLNPILRSSSRGQNALLPNTWTPNVMEVSAATGRGATSSCTNISETYKFHPRAKKLVHHRDDILMYSNLLTVPPCFQVPPIGTTPSYSSSLAAVGGMQFNYNISNNTITSSNNTASAFYNRSSLVSNSSDRVLRGTVEYTNSITSSAVKLGKSSNV